MACSIHKRSAEAGVSIPWFNVCFQLFQNNIAILKSIKFEEGPCKKGKFIRLPMILRLPALNHIAAPRFRISLGQNSISFPMKPFANLCQRCASILLNNQQLQQAAPNRCAQNKEWRNCCSPLGQAAWHPSPIVMPFQNSPSRPGNNSTGSRSTTKRGLVQ